MHEKEVETDFKLKFYVLLLLKLSALFQEVSEVRIEATGKENRLTHSRAVDCSD